MRSISTSGLTYAIEELGRGRPVLLVHGFPLDHSMWKEQARVLANEGRVLSPDLRGFGQTPLAAIEADADDLAAKGVSMEAYADDLAAALDALGIDEPVTFAGFSMGGYIAWQFWKKYRQRIAALVLCDTRAVADTEEARQGRLQMAEDVLVRGSSYAAEVMLPKLFAPQTLSERPEVVEPFRQIISSTDPRAIAAAQRGMAGRPDVTSWLVQIDVPALVIVGELDAISRVEEMRAMAAALPNAQFVVVMNAGHMAPVENPHEVNAALVPFIERV